MTEFLRTFRRCSQLSSLEKLTDKLKYELADDQVETMKKAAMHRRAEILSGRFFEEGSISPELLSFIA